ncbi:MAG: hypothetical protein COA96_09110 [SAR86 cluster bacterium]|uniref:Uncharacterized protein n=1 Tax=SAR86 cluster bacterium TaxID=2030880 RepID=A0A2A5AZ11_9GAMM|nr:MAG: hypothetical protein COA96_09110 [SAR86 cluster bacterium]
MKYSAINLNHYQFVRVSGSDAISFLQGQVSCNMELLSSERSLTGAICSLKGRVVADFRAVKTADGCLLQTAAGMAQPIIETLSKYAIFSKVEISIADQSPGENSVSAIGFIDSHCAALLESTFADCPVDENQSIQLLDMTLIKIAGTSGRFELWMHSNKARETFLSNTDLKLDDCLVAWNAEDISAGIVHVTKNLSEEYTPQLLNYDISGIVDFTKGCYTGQEVVARMYYRGNAKKRLFLVSSSHPASEHSEITIDGASGSKNGTILGFGNSKKLEQTSYLLLAVLNTQAVEDKASFQLSDQQESVLEIQQLPYAIPAATD